MCPAAGGRAWPSTAASGCRACATGSTGRRGRPDACGYGNRRDRRLPPQGLDEAPPPCRSSADEVVRLPSRPGSGCGEQHPRVLEAAGQSTKTAPGRSKPGSSGAKERKPASVTVARASSRRRSTRLALPRRLIARRRRSRPGTSRRSGSAGCSGSGRGGSAPRPGRSAGREVRRRDEVEDRVGLGLVGVEVGLADRPAAQGLGARAEVARRRARGSGRPSASTSRRTCAAARVLER